MTDLVVAPIVEGKGEIEAIRLLVQRIGYERERPRHIEVLRPFKLPRPHFFAQQSQELAKRLDASVVKLRQFSDQRAVQLILVLCDRDPDLDPVCLLGPKLAERVQQLRSDVPSACVLADIEYESWFVAAAESLSAYLDIADTVKHGVPTVGSKRWVQKHWTQGSYKPTVDQPKLTRAMDLGLCRRNSPSFDKLCRELEKYLT